MGLQETKRLSPIKGATSGSWLQAELQLEVKIYKVDSGNASPVLLGELKQKRKQRVVNIGVNDTVWSEIYWN